jgi:hypothetical protein
MKGVSDANPGGVTTRDQASKLDGRYIIASSVQNNMVPDNEATVGAMSVQLLGLNAVRQRCLPGKDQTGGR